MARAIRVEYPGAYYHVTSRGVGGQEIFLADEDREAFLAYVAEAHERWGLVVHGYCLMSNHYHLEVETPEGELSRPLQWINHRYANWLNRGHGRAGHVFQGRFKSAVVEAEAHLHELTRYIHLNPVRAKMVKHPADWSWSSYRVFVGLCRKPRWLDVEGTLQRFGERRAEQYRAYRRFVEKPGEVVENPMRKLEYGVILGGARFVDWVRAKLSEKKADAEVSQLWKIRLRPSLEWICAEVGSRLGASEEGIRAKGRHGNTGRDAALYLARRYSGLKTAEIGRYFGGVSSAAVSIGCNRAEGKLARKGAWRRKVADIAAKLEETWPNT